MRQSHAHPTYRRRLAIACTSRATIPLAHVVIADARVPLARRPAIEFDAITNARRVSS